MLSSMHFLHISSQNIILGQDFFFLSPRSPNPSMISPSHYVLLRFTNINSLNLLRLHMCVIWHQLILSCSVEFFCLIVSQCKSTLSAFYPSFPSFRSLCILHFIGQVSLPYADTPWHFEHSVQNACINVYFIYFI